MKRPLVVAEIGCNHRGRLDTAKEMIRIAATVCKVDSVKFQKRSPRELLTPDQYDAPHPVPENAYGETYGSHREYLEFSLDQHHKLKEWCDELGVIYSTSVWDMTSTKEIISLQPKMIKVPSATNLDFDILSCLCDEYGGEIHLSIGMTTPEETSCIVEFLEGRGRGQDVVLYACTSGYPVPYEDICLREIERLKQQYVSRVKAIGFSGHHLGIAVDIAAVALGAEWIERHFTLDKTWKGTDHSASLEPEEMSCLVHDVEAVTRALRFKEEDILPIEKVQRDKLKSAKQLA